MSNQWYIFCILFIYCSKTVEAKSSFAAINSVDDFTEVLQNFLARSDTKISTQCSHHMYAYLYGLIGSETWALQMFDAGSKLQSGILEGNIFDFGNFDECLKVEGSTIEGEEIKGKYCLGPIALSSRQKNSTKQEFQRSTEAPKLKSQLYLLAKINAQIATCLPDSCSSKDIYEIYRIFGLETAFDDSLCQSKNTQPELGALAISVIVFYAVVLIIVCLSTTYEIYQVYYAKAGITTELFIAFSVVSNTRKIVKLSKNPDQISCLYGIRVISIMWIILGHRYEISASLPVINALKILDWIQEDKNLYITGGTVSVDTFLLISGLVVSYTFMNAMAKGVKFNIFMFYLHRYLRLTPVLGALILIYAGLIVHMGSGPLWKVFVEPVVETCQDHWWSSLLYVQNYVNQGYICMGQTWYLSVDTQLFFLSPIVLLPLKYKPKLGLALTGVLALCSMVSCFVIIWEYEFSSFIVGNQDNFEDSLNFATLYYQATHTRASVWLMGIIMGYVIFTIKRNKRKIVISKVTAYCLWIASLTILFVCVFVGHNVVGDEYNKLDNAFYAALMRPGWALGVSWVIYACVTGYGGLVNSFLSLPIFEILSKLSYCMYLTHVLVLFLMMCQVRTVSYFRDLYLLHEFWGDFVYTMVLSMVFTLMFESPMVTIEKVLFGRNQKKKEVKNEKDGEKSTIEASLP